MWVLRFRLPPCAFLDCQSFHGLAFVEFVTVPTVLQTPADNTYFVRSVVDRGTWQVVPDEVLGLLTYTA